MFAVKISYFLPMIVSLFLHCNGGTLLDSEASLESTMYTILIMLILHKMKVLYTNFGDSMWIKFIESFVIFILIQATLFVSWDNIEMIGNNVARYIVLKWVNEDSSWMARKLVDSSGTLFILGLEYLTFLWLFDLNDLLELFGEHDLMTYS